MAFPEFYAAAPSITLYDPLAKLLGASDDGTMQYSYEHVVRLAGHSCPTVAGAWLMTVAALRALYPDETPQRGDIDVQFADSATAGVTGVIANVVSFATGAMAETGFKGLAGQHVRRDLLHFDATIPGEIVFTRRDTGASVAVSFNAQGVHGSPKAMPLLQKILANQASEDEKTEFASLWQERVGRILQAIDQPGVINLQHLKQAA